MKVHHSVVLMKAKPGFEGTLSQETLEHFEEQGDAPECNPRLNDLGRDKSWHGKMTTEKDKVTCLQCRACLKKKRGKK